MDAHVTKWAEMTEDHPVNLLHRHKLEAANMLVARVRLEKGCHVAVHSHESEQVAIVLSGRVRWRLGEGGREVETVGGDVVHLPSNVPHGVDAIEDTLILDVLSPAGPMGVDSQGLGD